MNETRVFADGYCGVFQKQEEFLACLKSIGGNSFWERRNSKNLRLVAITNGSRVEEELKGKYANEGLDEGIITDTIIVNNFMSCHRFNLTCCRKITHFPVTQSIVYTTIYFQSTAALRTAFSMFLSYIV